MPDYKRPALWPETFQRLDVYRAQNGYNTFNEAIEALLDEADDG